MIYLISQDWVNTSNNHAGMKYLCKQLETIHPENYKSIVFPDFYAKKRKGGIIRNIINSYICKFQHKKEEHKVLRFLRSKLGKGDVVFLLEYLGKEYEMFSFARRVKHDFPYVRLFCMAHLVPDKFNKLFAKDEELLMWIRPVDKLFVLGSSLQEYLITRGVDKTKLITTFHYVDDYYKKNTPIGLNSPPLVIAMGNQVRNIKVLRLVVENNPDVNFVICQGLMDLSKSFNMYRNVKLIPFVPEKQLRELMDKADISLNVMDDTIGSNVIVTSMAMGLAMICSDVGSIRDYCDNTNAIFCNNNEPDSFSKAIKFLQDTNRIIKMKEASMSKASLLSIDSFHSFIKSI